MQKVIINDMSKDNEDGYSKKMLNNHLVYGSHFSEFVESQKRGPKPDGSFKKKGINNIGAANLREESYNILSHCNPHDAVNNVETTHLVVGYVQSGKTMSFTGVTALALDNGYRLVVYLAGTKTNLLEQTSKRLEKDLIGKDKHNRDFYQLHKDPTCADIEQITGHLFLSTKPIILIPILKHYKHIDELTKIFDSSEFKDAMEGETVLIVDDEADQASLNSYGRKNSKKHENGESEEDLESKTYEAILKMRAVLPGNSYIQYTATPQANLLISMQDLLSPKSHTLLTPGYGYVGGKLYFGKGENHDLFNGNLIKTIPEQEVFHKKYNPLKKMPKSLKDALMLHVLAVTIIVKYLRVDGVNFLSMMVHPDNTKKWNRKFKDWIDAQLHSWRDSMRKPDGNDDKVDLIERFERLFPMAVEDYPNDDKPEFDDVRPFISDVLNDYQTYLVNTDKDAQTTIEWDNYSMHILVGAEMLNRGFTIENLATTYMPRYTKGPSNADTIQQRCRFFGYKMDYIRSCRVFLPEWSVTDYVDYVNHEEELRSALATSDNLASAERKILLSPGLRPTRQNVLPISVVNERLRGIHGLEAFESKATIDSNKSLVEIFLKKYEGNFDIYYKYNTADRTHRGFQLPIDDAIEFLSDFRFGNFRDATRKAATIRYLRYLSGMEDNPISYIYFIQMAYGADIRHRNFDNDAKRLKVGSKYFAGPSSEADSTNYPGDMKIVGGDETITIQLHHIYLDNASIDFPHETYTLAIYYPDALAINYCSNEQDKQDEEDDDDE